MKRRRELIMDSEGPLKTKGALRKVEEWAIEIEEALQKLKPLAEGEIDRLRIDHVLAESKAQAAMEDTFRVMLAGRD
jgi:hypothetical protein